MPFTPRYGLLMQRQIIGSVLGDQSSTLSSRPGQYVCVVAIPKVRNVCDGDHVVSTLPQLIGNRGRKMLV